MNATPATDSQKIETFVVEVDGVRETQESSFVDAVRAAMEIRRSAPDRKIRVRDASAYSAAREQPTVAA